MFKQVWSRFEKESSAAFINRLPSEIEVSWFRDGDFIIGDVVAGQRKLMTQARSAAEFVEMVNDAILAAYEFPQDGRELVPKIFAPTEADFNQLKDAAAVK